MNKKPIKSRINDLENKKDQDDQDQIIIVWDDDDPRPELQPGDIRVWMDPEGEVHRQVIK